MADDWIRRPLDHLQQHACIPFQFMLSEFLLMAPEVEVVEVAVEQLDFSGREAEAVVQTALASLRQSLGALLGPTRSTTVALGGWHEGTGLLRKFHRYCHELRLEGELGGSLSRVRRSADEALHALGRGQAANGMDKDQVGVHCRRALRECNVISTTLPSLLSVFNREENVLFFLLRHRQQLDAIYHQGFVRGVFDAMFAEGCSQAEGFLLERYGARGFSHLLSHISTCMAALS